MSYSDDPVRDASRHLDAQWETSHDKEQHTKRVVAAFVSDWLTQPMTAPTQFRDETRNIYTYPRAGGVVKTPRPATVGEVVFDSLDHSRGPSFDDLLTLIRRAANGEAIKDDALDLVNRLAATFAYYKE